MPLWIAISMNAIMFAALISPLIIIAVRAHRENKKNKVRRRDGQ